MPNPLPERVDTLIERLRQAEEMDRSLGLDILETLFGEAADRIEQDAKRIEELEVMLKEACGAIGFCVDSFERDSRTLGGLAAIHMLKQARESYLTALQEPDNG